MSKQVALMATLVTLAWSSQLGCGANGSTLSIASSSNEGSVSAHPLGRLRVTYGLPIFSEPFPELERSFHTRDSTGAAYFIVSGVRARVTQQDVQLANDILLDIPSNATFAECGDVALFGGAALYRSEGLTGPLEAVPNVQAVLELDVAGQVALIRTQVRTYQLRCDTTSAAEAIVVASSDARAVERVVGNESIWFATLSDGSLYSSTDHGAAWSRVQVGAGPVADLRELDDGTFFVTVAGARYPISVHGDTALVSNAADSTPVPAHVPAAGPTEGELARLDEALATARIARVAPLRDGRIVSFAREAAHNNSAVTHAVIRTRTGETRSLRVMESEPLVIAWADNWGERVVVSVHEGRTQRSHYFELTRSNELVALPLGMSEHVGPMIFDESGRFLALSPGEDRLTRLPSQCSEALCVVDTREHTVRSVGAPEGDVYLQRLSDDGTLWFVARNENETTNWLLSPLDSSLRRTPDIFDHTDELTLTREGVLIGRERIPPLPRANALTHPHLYRWDVHTAHSEVQSLALPDNTRSIVFMSSADGVAVGESLADVYLSNDGGQSWHHEVPSVLGDARNAVFDTHLVECMIGTCWVDRLLAIDFDVPTSPVSQFLAAHEGHTWPVVPRPRPQNLAFPAEREELRCTFGATQTVDSMHDVVRVNDAFAGGVIVREMRGTQARFVWFGLDDRGRFRVDTPWRANSTPSATQLDALRGQCLVTLLSRTQVFFECEQTTTTIDSRGNIRSGLPRGTIVGDDYEAHVGALRRIAMGNDSVPDMPTTGYVEGQPSEFLLRRPYFGRDASSYFVVAAPIVATAASVPTVFDWDGRIEHACDPALDPRTNSVWTGVEQWLPIDNLGQSSARLIPNAGTLCINRIDGGEAEGDELKISVLHTLGNDSFAGTELQVGFVNDDYSLEVRERELRCVLQHP